MEKDNSIIEIRNKGITDFGLAGRLLTIDGNRVPLKPGYVYNSPEEIWITEMDYLMENAKTHEDLHAIGAKINYAKENNLKVNIWDYQFAAPKIMRKIYNVIGEPPRPRGERIQIKRSELVE
jgi:hypothetical protein